VQTNVGVVTITWQDLGLLLRCVDVREGWPFDAPRPVMLSDEERLAVLFALARLNEDEVTPTLSLPPGDARRRVSLVCLLGGLGQALLAVPLLILLTPLRLVGLGLGELLLR
jgi:hypothetical protein